MPIKNLGVAQKCTMCYDRLKQGEQPACSKTCPTDSIQFGPYEEMVAAAKERVRVLHEQGLTEARLYGANQDDGVGGTGSIFLLLDSPEVYGLPPDPRVPTADLPQMYKTAAKAIGGMALAVAGSFLIGGRKGATLMNTVHRSRSAAIATGSSTVQSRRRSGSGRARVRRTAPKRSAWRRTSSSRLTMADQW